MAITGKDWLEEYKKKNPGNYISSENTKSTSITGAQLLEEYNKNKQGQSTTTESSVEKGGWFQKSSLFDDGYQFGDVFKTGVGTTTDLVTNLAAGLLGMGESAVDAVASLIPGTSDFVKKDLYDEEAIMKSIFSDSVKALTGIDSETDSVLGQKMDNLGQSAGQLAGTIGLQAVGVPWWVTTGATAFGSETENAFNQGATQGEAVFSGLVSAAGEILSEKLSGGISFGGKTLDDVTVKPLLSKISNRTVRKLANLGLDMSLEGAEEILSGVISAIGQKLSYASESEFNELFSSEDALDSFIGGAILSFGGSAVRRGVQVPSNIRAKQTYGDNQSIQDLLIESANIGGEAANVADWYTDKYGKKGKLSGADINDIINTRERELITQDKANIKMDSEAKLIEHDETGDVSAIADVLVKQATGEKLKSKDLNILNKSKAGHLVSTQMNPDNIKSGALHDDWATYMGTSRIRPDVYNRKGYALGKTIADASKHASFMDDDEAEEAQIKVSDNGKNMYYDAKAKEYVDADIKGIVSTEGGIKVELENGKTVSASDLAFASREEGVVYEMLARMGVTPETANEIINTFKPSNEKQADLYFDSIPLAYRMGLMGNEQGLKYVNLTDAQKRLLYNRGRIDAVTNAKERDNARATSSKKATAKVSTGKGIIFENGFVYNEASASDLQRMGMAGAEAIAKTTNLEVHVFDSKLESDANGYFKDGNKIYINLSAGMNAEGAMLYALSHEVTHYIRKWNAQGFKDLADFLIAEYGKHGVNINALIKRQKDKIKKRYSKEGEVLPNDAKLFDMAYEEVVADAMSDMLADTKAYEKFAKLKKKNFKLWQKLGEIIKKVLDKLKNALNIYRKDSPVAVEALLVRDFSQEVYDKLQDLYIKAFVEADANYEASGGELRELDGNENEHLFSDKSMIEGAGLQFIINENGSGYKVLDKSGNPVKSVTAEMIVDSPLGNLVTMAKNEGFLGKGKEATLAAKKQYEFLAELVNMCINYNGIAPIWETAGTMVFSSMKSNADKQYGLTVDFSTVCKKTQAVVDAMSEAMLRLGRGLTRSEVETIYLEVGKAGESTPCPVCYVFSRWMGIGGILDQISRFQDKYTAMSEASLQEFIADIQERIRETANTPDKKGKLKSKFFNAKGEISEGQVVAELKSKASNKAASALKGIANNSDIQLEIQELEALMEAQDSKDAKKTADKIKKLQKKLQDVSSLEKEMRDANDTLEEYEAYQWLTRTMMMESDGKWVKNSAFKPVPKDILFDLNKGDKFAEGYPLSWAFRTGKGASAGKAIVPYADARVGEAIQAVASQSPKDIKIGMELNPFLNADTAGRLKILKSAIAKQARQNLVGGQRYQSTSDFRYEYGSDYLITFLEMQAIGAKVQLYTKVIEAVDFLASMGADCNLSVMPLSDGFITLPDGTKKLVYSSVTGINAEAAIKKSQEYNNVQLILVGISDEHIRLALEGTDVTFVIPFHGSGNSVHQIQALMNLLGENLDVTTAQDYTAVQSDHVSPNQTKEQKAMWNLRVKIIKGEASKITAAEQDLLDKNPYLKDLYRRFYIDSKAEEYGVGLTSGQAEQIFPYEYWDKSLTYAEADKNGDRFKEYCASMGIIPRFSGMNSKGENVGFGDFTSDKGYWKLLIDRPMYDNTYDSDGNWTGYGKYHEQARINCSNFNVKHLDPEYGSATYGEVMSKANDPKKTNKIVDAALKQFENNEINDVRSEDDTQFSDRDSYTIANDFVSHMENIIKNRGGWYVTDVFDYASNNPELNFIERIFAKDKDVKDDLAEFLGGIDDTRTLHLLSWYLGEAYAGKAPKWGENGKMVYPYRGAIRTFRNAINKRSNEIMTAKVNGTNLGIKNGTVSLSEIKDMFNRLNSNEEIGKFAEKVFATAEKLGVNIRFANQVFSNKKVAGDIVGDMIEYKTSYFNNTAYSDQKKAGTILHELLHACTLYVMKANPYTGDVYYTGSKTRNYEIIANAATRLNRIYMEIANDPDFKGEYGIKNAEEMVAELGKEGFVGKLKQKNLWQKIVDWICELFGIKSNSSAYENARMCVDFILDNPDISEYKDYVAEKRMTARRLGMDVFGKTIDNDGQVLYSNRDTESDIHYSLRDVAPVEPTTDKWQRTHTTSEVKTMFPDLWDVSADESVVRNPTQISGTVKSYRKVYDFLKKTGFNGTILDASSGLGYGTRAGIEEYGFDVEDIEPYPDKSYSPKYTDYSTLDKQYDVIISNAVLNVIPQDQRDALVVKMGELLKNGGRMFINVRGDDVKNASSKVAINEDLMEYYISKSGSYQKGFTKSELVAYLQDALGDGFTVAPTTFFGKTSAVVTKNEVRYSDRDTDAVSNRTLLANALETVAQNDIEKAKLAQYKKKIALIESEQKKLNDIKAIANSIRFTKGRTSAETKQMRDLDFEATQTANRINTYDKQLLNLESTKALKNVLEREKTILRKRLEKQGKEALQAQRAKNAETVREIMTRNTESRHKAVEGRHKTEMRRDIKKLLQRLNKLFKGGKERNVKEGMKEAVSTALALGDVLFSNEISNLDIVNLGVESVTEKESKHLDEYRDLLMKKESNLDRIRTLRAGVDVDNKEQTYAYISELEAQNRKYDRRMSELNGLLSDVFVRERARLNRMPVNTLIDELASEYHELQSSEYEYIKNAYNPELFDKLISLKKNLGGVVARDMSLYQLEQVKKVFTMLEHSIRTANQEFRNGKWEDLQQSASAVMEEIETLRDIKQEGASATSKIRSFLWNELIPYYAFDKIGSKTLMAYYKDLMKGQAVAARDSAESKAFAQATREKYNYSKWKLDEIHEFQLSDGRTFRTTLKHLLSVYAYSKREQAELHMSIGGFFHNDKATFRKEKGILKMVRTDAVGYKVDANVLAQIKTALGNEKMSYVDEMLDYLTKMGEKGNEVTRVMWGVDIFTEKVYFPLKSKEDFLKKSTETAQAVSLKNDGMTKETVPGASNPIVLEAFDDVWANHVERMSVYHGFVIPIDNLNKVLHYGTWVGTDAMSVSTMLEGKFTSAATDYLEQFIKDLNGGAVVQGATNPFMSFFAKFKKTAVGASLSTVVQQPTAIIRAMAEIDAKYFVGKPHLTKLSERLKELKTYAPIAIIKDIGGFDAGGSKSIARWINSDTLTGIDKVMNTIDDVSMKGAEYADWIGWLTIWEAVKRETKATTDLAFDSKEFLDKCGERFEEVIMKTQVYDSTLSRSGFMRSKNDGVKMLTSFMGEPTLSINMLYSAVINAFRGGKEAKLKAAKTIGYVYLAMILAEALSSAIYALRDDDEDESYMEKYLQSLGSGVISDVVLAPVTSLPGVKDIVSIFQGWDVERSDMAIFKDIKDAFDGLDSESKSSYRKVEDFAGAIAAAFGLPVKNVLRTGREIYNAGSHVFDDVSGGSAWDAFAEGVTGEKSTTTSENLHKAIIKGDHSRIESYKKGYKNEAAYETAVRNALRANDSRIKEAAQARLDGNIARYARIARAIISEGRFSQDIVVGAINAEMDAIKRGETIESEPTEDKDEVTSIYSGSDINSAFDNGDSQLAQQIIADLIETKVANGMEERDAKSSLRSSMTSYWKPLFKQAYKSGNNSEMARIRRILYASGLYGTSNDVVKTTQNWLKS